MVQFNPINFISKSFNLETKKNTPTTIASQNTIVEQGDGLDTFEFSTKNGEKFEDVFNEMRTNVPDRTTTIEEKELAIEYIDRMLACSDISDDLKIYWQNKKEVIEMEIQNIKNEEKLRTGGESIDDVWKEFSAFTDRYFKLNDNLNFEDKFENRMTYYATYKSFCLRFLACEGLTDEQRAEYNRMMQNADRDIANWIRDYNNYMRDENN